MDVVGFGVGEPVFCTRRNISRDACNKALAEGFTKYTAAAGILNCASIGRRLNKARQRPDLNLANRSKPAAASIPATTSCSRHLRGRRPGHHPRAVLAELSGDGQARKGRHASHPRKPRTRPCSKSLPSNCAARLINTPRTRLFVLNSPSNPTGSIYTRAEIKALEERYLRGKKAKLILSDEIVRSF